MNKENIDLTFELLEDELTTHYRDGYQTISHHKLRHHPTYADYETSYGYKTAIITAILIWKLEVWYERNADSRTKQESVDF